jgi:hypothetical protein
MPALSPGKILWLIATNLETPNNPSLAYFTRPDYPGIGSLLALAANLQLATILVGRPKYDLVGGANGNNRPGF